MPNAKEKKLSDAELLKELSRRGLTLKLKPCGKWAMCPQVVKVFK